MSMATPTSAAPRREPALPSQRALAALLDQFAPISLQEMDAVALLNRVDIKFILTPEQLVDALTPLAPHYRVLSVAGIRLNRYHTLYFDTPEFGLYRIHHSGRQVRYKVRFRSYVDSNLTYFEVKQKDNKGRTLKSRQRVASLTSRIDDPLAQFLHDSLHHPAPPLEAKLGNHFVRVTLVSNQHIERLTLDFDLSFVCPQRITTAPRLAIAEVKQEGFSRQSQFLHRMRAVHAQEMGFSKYCIGAATLYPHLKQNNFKPIFLRLHKLGAAPMSATIEPHPARWATQVEKAL